MPRVVSLVARILVAGPWETRPSVSNTLRTSVARSIAITRARRVSRSPKIGEGPEMRALRRLKKRAGARLRRDPHSRPGIS